MNIIRTSLALSVLTTIAFSGAQAQDLVYVAADPCRVADTRKASEGYIRGNTNRNFRVVGTSGELAVQGGQVDCLNPKGATNPVAVAAYILAVPAASSKGSGVLSAYPSNLPLPPAGSGSTVNFAKDQVIGNTTIVSVCSSNECPAGGVLAVLARNTDEHVVIDVQGYFYPSSGDGGTGGREVVERTITPEVPQNTVLSESLSCPEGKVAMSGGYTLTGQDSWIYSINSSAPTADPRVWKFTYRVSYDPNAGTVPIYLYAICSNG